MSIESNFMFKQKYKMTKLCQITFRKEKRILDFGWSINMVQISVRMNHIIDVHIHLGRAILIALYILNNIFQKKLLYFFDEKRNYFIIFMCGGVVEK